MSIFDHLKQTLVHRGRQGANDEDIEKGQGRPAVPVVAGIDVNRVALNDMGRSFGSLNIEDLDTNESDETSVSPRRIVRFDGAPLSINDASSNRDLGKGRELEDGAQYDQESGKESEGYAADVDSDQVMMPSQGLRRLVSPPKPKSRKEHDSPDEEEPPTMGPGNKPIPKIILTRPYGTTADPAKAKYIPLRWYLADPKPPHQPDLLAPPR
jgi:hypothetical protein